MLRKIKKAARIGAKVIEKFVLDASSNGTAEGLEDTVSKLRTLSTILESEGGLLAKVSQLLNVSNEDATVFANCFRSGPANCDTDHFLKSEDRGYEIPFGWEKSGSLSQLYVTTHPVHGSKMAVKVQYVGLRESVGDDITMLDLIARVMYINNKLDEAIEEIKETTLAELDYLREAAQQIWFSQHAPPNVRIPEVYLEFCTGQILATEFIEPHVDFASFLKTAPAREKERIGLDLQRFVFEPLFRHGVFYSDIHFGNFLIDAQNRLVVVDFGCCHLLGDDLRGKLARIWDDGANIATLIEVGILPADLSQEEFQYAADFFERVLRPFKTRGFTFTEQYWCEVTERNTTLMQNWNLPKGFVYFNKVVYNAYRILAKLESKSFFWPVAAEI